ncbi:hypothetical protein HK100_009244 [Physocladia obscura]|uniref:PH domain-containing protein n=1 Tax=Physocladia obscura TaxID=109957 RepID=A0AAD5SPT7_9FUNG|nr:hypothetical protein HK100_009244 [Physocladia obscura]
MQERSLSASNVSVVGGNSLKNGPIDFNKSPRSSNGSSDATIVVPSPILKPSKLTVSKEQVAENQEESKALESTETKIINKNPPHSVADADAAEYDFDSSGYKERAMEQQQEQNKLSWWTNVFIAGLLRAPPQKNTAKMAQQQRRRTDSVESLRSISSHNSKLDNTMECITEDVEEQVADRGRPVLSNIITPNYLINSCTFGSLRRSYPVMRRQNEKHPKSPSPNISPNISVSSSLTLSEATQPPDSANSNSSSSITTVIQAVWKKRFFVLTSDGKLFAFRPNPTDFTTPIGHMITSAAITQEQHNVFKVFGNTVRASDGALQNHTWTLRGGGGEDVDVWIDCIDRVVSCAQEDVLERLEHAFTSRSVSSRRSSHATLVGIGSLRRGGGGGTVGGGSIVMNTSGAGVDGLDENNANSNQGSSGSGLERANSLRGRERVRKLFPSKSILTLETRVGGKNHKQENNGSSSLGSAVAANGGGGRNSSVSRASLSATSVTTPTSPRPLPPVTIEGLVRKNTNASLRSAESITQKTGRWFKWLVKASDGGAAVGKR